MMRHIALLKRRFQRQRQKESRSLSLRGLQPEPPPMSLDEFAAEVKPQTRARDLRSSCILCPYEPPKNTGLLVSGNTNAAVADREERNVWFDLFTQGQFDRSPLWTVLHSIAEQVVQHLLDASLVDFYDEGGELRLERERMPAGRHLHLRHHVFGQCHQVGSFARQRQSP